MPANLTPEYEKAEQRYRQARTDEEKLVCLQEMLRLIPKHKGTDHMQADLKRRISQLKKATAKKNAGKGVDLFHVPRSGAGQVVVVGMPNAGKSALVAAGINAPVKIADHPYATALPTPGMWQYEDVQIQLVDTPPLAPDAIPPGLMGTIRFGELVLFVIDAAGDPLEQLEGLLEVFDARDLDTRTIPRSRMDPDNPRQMSVLIAANKIDRADHETVETLRQLYAGRFEIVPVSSVTGEGLDRLGRRLWELLDVIRVYTKQPGKPIDLDRPYTLPAGATLEDLAREIHRDLPEMMKYARIWGPGRHDGQRIQRAETLHDKDAVEIHR